MEPGSPFGDDRQVPLRDGRLLGTERGVHRHRATGESASSRCCGARPYRRTMPDATTAHATNSQAARQLASARVTASAVVPKSRSPHHRKTSEAGPEALSTSSLPNLRDQVPGCH
jgi:hypothetical protein